MMLPVALLTLATLLVVASSATEVTLYAVPYSRVRDLDRAAARGARSLKSLRDRPTALLSTAWTLRMAGAVLAALAVWRFADILAAGSVLGVVLAVAAVVLWLVLAEFAGKALSQHAVERLALVVAPLVWVLSHALIPLTWPAEQLVRRLSPKFAEVLPGISDREIRDLVSPGNGEQTIEEHERRLIQRAFLLDQTSAYDVMTPRVDMFSWAETRSLAEIASELRTVRYSRVPLYNETVDRITGILYIRDAYQALISGQRDIPLRALSREPFFVPGSVTLDKLLLDFQARRIHMGIVIDEYGGVDGLITLEDILEELVGEIIDESDIAEEPIIRLSRNEILVDGTADLREINHFFNTSFPLLEHRSLNGYLLELFGQVPQPGEKITREGVVIEVTAASDTQILRARLTRLTPRSAEGEGAPKRASAEAESPAAPSAEYHPSTGGRTSGRSGDAG